MVSVTNRAWERLIDELGMQRALEEAGYALFSADQIRTITGREPRLMTKFDTRQSRPPALRRLNGTILPIRNGEYCLVKGDGYVSAPMVQGPVLYVPGLERFETLTQDCTSESQVLDLAAASGILEHFFGDRSLVLTVRGRLRSPSFSYSFRGLRRNIQVDVDGVQVEVDAGYEGEKLYLVEAKMGARDDFLSRQLFYPVKMWTERGVRKPIVPIFIHYSNQSITISEFTYRDLNIYQSLTHLRTRKYAFGPPEVNTPDIRKILTETPLEPEPCGTPFPQANDFNKVIDILDAVSNGVTANAALAEFYDFDIRQAAYYIDAARYLGWISGREQDISLTDRGATFAEQSFANRGPAALQAMVARIVFRRSVEYVYANRQIPPRTLIMAWIEAAHPELSPSTVQRRAGTVISWLNWIVQTDLFARERI